MPTAKMRRIVTSSAATATCGGARQHSATAFFVELIFDVVIWRR